MAIKEDTNLMRITGLVCTPDPDDPSNGMYPPMLTQAQIDAIPSDEIQPGGIVFNIDTEELETYTAAEAWVSVITEGSDDITFIDLTVTNLTVTDTITTVDLTVTGAATIDTLTVLNNLTTDDLLVNNTANIDTLNVINDALISGDLTVQGLSNLQDLRIGSFNNGGTLAGSTDVTADPQIIMVPGPAAGTGPTVSIEGSPISGSIRILTGTGATDGVIATFTLPNTVWKQFSAPWGVVLTSASAGAAGRDWFIFDQTLATANSAASFTLNTTAGSGLSDTTNYWWNYHIIGNSDTP